MCICDACLPVASHYAGRRIITSPEGNMRFKRRDGDEVRGGALVRNGARMGLDRAVIMQLHYCMYLS